MTKKIIVIAIAFLLAFGVTIPKLYKMFQIKELLPGASKAQETITQKWHQSSEEHPDGRDVYWISWTEKDIREIGNHRTNMEEKRLGWG